MLLVLVVYLSRLSVIIIFCFKSFRKKLFVLELMSTYEHQKLSHLNQFGSRKGNTTEMAKSFVTTTINDAIDKNLRVAGVILDLNQAFDTIDHQILL